MTIAETVKLDDGYTIEFHYDEDARNPFKKFDCEPTLVLHNQAEQKFGWTTDDEWRERLTGALDRIAERGHTKRLYGDGGALHVVRRWMRAFYGIQVVLPVAAGDHSGYWTYLGEGASFSDPGGWDSGWVGWLFLTPAQLKEWGHDAPLTDERVEELLAGSFETFRAWVAQEVYGWTAVAPDGEIIESCWGYYGNEEIGESGYARECALGAIEGHRGGAAEDVSEIEEMRLAEVGA